MLPTFAIWAVPFFERLHQYFQHHHERVIHHLSLSARLLRLLAEFWLPSNLL